MTALCAQSLKLPVLGGPNEAYVMFLLAFFFFLKQSWVSFSVVCSSN